MERGLAFGRGPSSSFRPGARYFLGLVVGGWGRVNKSRPHAPERSREVFVRARRGLSHVHAGSLHAPDAEMALRNARDLYTRRGEGVSLWVVRASDIEASTPDERDSFFDPAGDKIYRHPTFYDVPEGVEHL